MGFSPSLRVWSHAIARFLAWVLPGGWILLQAGGAGAWMNGTLRDERSIRQLIQAHADAWNRGDAEAAANVYRDDADLWTTSGAKIRGRAEILRVHREWLAQDAKLGGSIHTHPSDSIQIHFLDSNVAICDAESCYRLRGHPGEYPPAPECSRLFLVLTKEDGKWLIVAQRSLGLLPP
jgi:uncharacterized protein (TIGR02246 family)